MTRARHLASTAASESTCGGCGHPILTALDEGLLARVDASPITPTSEIAALLAGITTYTRTAGADLIERDAARIARPLAPGHTIHGAHQCALTRTDTR